MQTRNDLALLLRIQPVVKAYLVKLLMGVESGSAPARALVGEMEAQGATVRLVWMATDEALVLHGAHQTRNIALIAKHECAELANRKARLFAQMVQDVITRA